MNHRNDPFDYLFRVIVIGDSGVGKTNLLLRFVKNEFEYETHPTIGIDFTTKTVELDEKNIKVQIWDTAGQDRFKFYRGSVAALLVYDITNPNTFKNLDKWLDDVRKYADPNIVMVLVGNKTDLDDARKINSLSGLEYAEINNMSFIETSALNSSNVEEAFMNVIKDVYYKYSKNDFGLIEPVQIRDKNNKSINIQEYHADTNKNCCF